MSDVPESPRRPTSAHAAHLQYPTLPPLSASVEEWLSRSRPANNMTSDNVDEVASGSLSESWATLSVSDLHSEDDNRSEQTDVGSLIDQTTPDDVASLDERYSGSEIGNHEYLHRRVGENDDDHDNFDEQETPATQLPPPLLFNTESAIDESNLTARPALRHSIDSIEFEEPEPEAWTEKERVEIRHTINIFGNNVIHSDIPDLPDTYPEDSDIIVTVQQTMTRKSLDLDKPFRVLYFGNPEFRDIVLDKIGDVLVSSPSAGSPTSSTESSRYHVVPTSFGMGAIPSHAELLPINVQLVVDECVEATSDTHSDRSNTLHLAFKNRPSCHSWWDKDQYRISSTSDWTLPDIAIIFISKHDDPFAIQGRFLAHQFLARHGTPSMLITEDPLWSQPDDFIPLNPSSLHMCLESRDPKSGASRVLKRFPIDLKTFESITPAQMNRNLASLIDLHQKKTSDPPQSPKSAIDHRSWIPNGYRSWSDRSWFDVEKHPGNWDWLQPMCARGPEWVSILRLLTLILVSTVAISLGYAALKTIFVFIAEWVASSALSQSIAPSPTPAISTAALTLQSMAQDSLSLRPPGNIGFVHKEPSGLSLVDQVAELTLASHGSNVDPNTFEIHAVGDCHILIKPPRNLGSTKRHRRFDVDVYRDGTPLTNEVSQLFEGVYTLRLDQEDAHGLVNVTITAKSKPAVVQSVIIDFGIPWLKISNWRKTAQTLSSQVTKDLQVAQNGLSDVYARLSTDLQVIMGDVVKRTHYLKEDAERLRQDSSNTRDLILHRSKQYSDAIVSNALQQFRSFSSMLHHRSVQVNREALGCFSNVWDRLGDSASQAELSSVVDRVRSANKATLDRAQTRARYFLGHINKKLECSQTKGSC